LIEHGCRTSVGFVEKSAEVLFEIFDGNLQMVHWARTLFDNKHNGYYFAKIEFGNFKFCDGFK